MNNKLRKLLPQVLIVALVLTGLSFFITTNGDEMVCYATPSNYGYLDEVPLENKYLTLHGFPAGYYNGESAKYCLVKDPTLSLNQIRQNFDSTSKVAADFSPVAFLYDFAIWTLFVGSISILYVILRRNK